MPIVLFPTTHSVKRFLSFKCSVMMVSKEPIWGEAARTTMQGNFKAKEIRDLISNKDSGLTGCITEFLLTFQVKDSRNGGGRGSGLKG